MISATICARMRICVCSNKLYRYKKKLYVIVEGWCIWLQNIDGLMMARQYDTSKHNECYRPIPVHTPSSRRVPVAKPYINLNTTEAANAPRYESEYDYKTTHYPSYPPNYPYDDNAKYKYEGQNNYNAYEKPNYPSYEDRSWVRRKKLYGPAHESTAESQLPIRFGVRKIPQL